jgi:hypothetical protein
MVLMWYLFSYPQRAKNCLVGCYKTLSSRSEAFHHSGYTVVPRFTLSLEFLMGGARGLTIKFANLPPCACHGSSGQKPQYGLMTFSYQRFTAVLFLNYGSLFLSGVYHCLSVFWCSIARMSEILVKLGKSGSEIREMLVQVYGKML